MLRDLGELEEARDLLMQAFESVQKSFEPGNPIIAALKDNIGSVLRDLGEPAEGRNWREGRIKLSKKKMVAF